MTDQTGHPLPESEEARHDEIPERVEQAKGEGDEGKAAIQPSQPAARPDGEPYRLDGRDDCIGDAPNIREPGASAWDREQGSAAGADTSPTGGQPTSWDQQQGIAEDIGAEGESEFERDQREHQRRGQDDVDNTG